MVIVGAPPIWEGSPSICEDTAIFIGVLAMVLVSPDK
jgi:hypothetical protein